MIENDPEQARTIRAMLYDRSVYHFALTLVASLLDAETYLAGHLVDIVLLDLELSDLNGPEMVRWARTVAPRASFVLLSNQDDEPKAIQAIHEGAQDYLIKAQIEPYKLMRVLDNAIERKMQEETLTRERDLAQSTLNCIADAVISTDVAGNITFLNPVAGNMMGWTLSDAVGRRLTDVFRIVDATTRKPIRNPMTKATVENLTGKLPLNCVLIHRDGHESFIEDSVAPIHDHEGKVTGAVIVFRDVSAARAQSEYLIHLAEHDSLTGLPNRLLFYDRIGQAIALSRRHQRRAAILFLDLDGFKHINDTLGHAAGDELLNSVAKRLLHCVRTPDTVSRQGGDEFIMLLQDLERPEDASSTAKRVLQAVTEVHLAGNRDVRVTASIGVSICPDDGLDAETLIKNADIAMYQAKKNGRQGFQFFRRDMNVSTVTPEFIEDGLRVALKRNELTLHYQPRVDLRTGAVIGAEALCRWNHPARGMIPPEQFIPIAEQSGTILPIGAWVLKEACAQARVWADAGMPTKTMAVNISNTQFQSGDFPDQLFSALSMTGLNPGFLELDVAESILMHHPEHAALVLKSLRDKGVRVSVDNFGTGHSSLSSLQKLPVNAIKIDSSIVRQITTAPAGRAAAETLIAMARRLRLRVIAQGVETTGDLEFLWAQECDEAQGNFFSRAIPPDQLTRMLLPN